MVCHWTSAVLVSRKKGIECVLLFYLKWLPRLILSQKRTFWRHLITRIKILGPPGPTPVKQKWNSDYNGDTLQNRDVLFFSLIVFWVATAPCAYKLGFLRCGIWNQSSLFTPILKQSRSWKKSVTIEPKQVQSEFVFKKRRNGIVTIFSPSFKEKETICYKLYNNSRSGENHTYVV